MIKIQAVKVDLAIFQCLHKGKHGVHCDHGFTLGIMPSQT